MSKHATNNGATFNSVSVKLNDYQIDSYIFFDSYSYYNNDTLSIRWNYGHHTLDLVYISYSSYNFLSNNVTLKYDLVEIFCDSAMFQYINGSYIFVHFIVYFSFPYDKETAFYDILSNVWDNSVHVYYFTGYKPSVKIYQVYNSCLVFLVVEGLSTASSDVFSMSSIIICVM